MRNIIVGIGFLWAFAAGFIVVGAKPVAAMNCACSDVCTTHGCIMVPPGGLWVKLVKHDDGFAFNCSGKALAGGYCAYAYFGESPGECNEGPYDAGEPMELIGPCNPN